MSQLATKISNVDGRRVEGMTRDEACVRFQKKVLLLARRVYERAPKDGHIGVDDLASVGAIGLLDAFDRFDESRGIRFSTFAEYRIRGAMCDALREGDPFSRRRRGLAKAVRHATDTLRLRLGREPRSSEVAAELEMTIDAYNAAVERTAPVTHVPFDVRPDAQGGEQLSLSERLAGNETDADDVLGDAETREALKVAIGKLPERQRQCVLMYYGKGLNLAEIACVFGVTPSRVSQVLTEARGRLRQLLSSTVDPSDVVLGFAP
jgi:RNA polymerase sigma factor FliA